MATPTRRVGAGKPRPTRTKAERAAIAQRMRDYHARRRREAAQAIERPAISLVNVERDAEIKQLRDQVNQLIWDVTQLIHRGVR